MSVMNCWMPRAVCMAFIGVWCCMAGPVQAQTLRYVGQQILPNAYTYQETTVGGLSGIDYEPRSNQFVVISDDRSEKEPARFYTLALDLAAFNQQAAPGDAGIHLLGMVPLRTLSGGYYPAGEIDPEEIRYAADGTLWFVSEGNVRRGVAPAVIQIDAAGQAIRELTLPAYVLPGDHQGVRDNLAFESLAISGNRVYVATENALVQDGPAADLAQPTAVRLFVFDRLSGKAVAEFVYETDAVMTAPALPGLYRTNGLVAILNDGPSLLAMERSYTAGVGNHVRIYQCDLSSASNVMTQRSLKDRPYQPVKKKLLLDLTTLGVPLDNLEGMSWGPLTADGHRTLILVSDNNFSDRQVTQFLAFEWIAEAKARKHQ